MTRHADRRPSGGKPRGNGEKRAQMREDWREDETFPVLDENLLLQDDPAASARQRRGKRAVR